MPFCKPKKLLDLRACHLLYQFYTPSYRTSMCMCGVKCVVRTNERTKQVRGNSNGSHRMPHVMLTISTTKTPSFSLSLSFSLLSLFLYHFLYLFLYHFLYLFLYHFLTPHSVSLFRSFPHSLPLSPSSLPPLPLFLSLTLPLFLSLTLPLIFFLVMAQPESTLTIFERFSHLANHCSVNGILQLIF